MIDRAIGMAGIAISILFGLILIVFPKLPRKMGIAGVVLGILLLGVAVGIALLPDGNAQSPPVVHQGPGSAFSFGQQGGITAGTVNIGPTDRGDRRIPLLAKLRQEYVLSHDGLSPGLITGTEPVPADWNE
jgi:hypothetical protein